MGEVTFGGETIPRLQLAIGHHGTKVGCNFIHGARSRLRLREGVHSDTTIVDLGLKVVIVERYATFRQTPPSVA